MRTTGSPDVLEYRRRLAVERVAEGYSTQEVAEFLGVDTSSVRRWVAAFRQHGASGLAAHAVPGRPPKLTATQEKVVLRWLDDCPTEHGFATDLWTAGRLARLIHREWGIALHEHYLSAWLRRRGYTPQKPERVPREGDDEAIEGWLATDWPRIKKSTSAGRIPPPAGRERAPDGPLAAAQLVTAGSPGQEPGEGQPPGKGLGGGGLVPDARARPVGPGLPDAGQRVLQ